MTTQTVSGHFIGNRWIEGGDQELVSRSPSSGDSLWQGQSATAELVHRAARAARAAQSVWWDVPVEKRIEFVLGFAELVKENADNLAELISRENGKPLWESIIEVNAVVGKAQLSIDAYRERRDTTTIELDGYNAVTRYKPFGVMGVLGPFNFPAHLPNGHIIPALIAGNTIVFKPSEQTPAVGEWMMRKWQAVGLPEGVVNLVQGGRETGMALANEPQLDGLLFTGSSHAGCALHKTFAKWPQKMLALEMGGNNPLIAADFSNAPAAAYTAILSAFLTAGQRCTCARRLIVVDGANADVLVDEIAALIPKIQVGYWDDQQVPFMGPVIDGQSGSRVLQAQQQMIDRGGRSIVEATPLRSNPALISPGVVDVSRISDRADHEVFGPLLQVIRVADFDAAIAEANNTAYGLSAGLICDDRGLYEKFIKHIRAGVVNWNRQTTGASGKLPFGGCGLSGNSRPGGYFAADYCNWPVASLESEQLVMPQQPMPGIDIQA